MGNRCVITTREDFNNDGIGIYLHWNGGRDSVEAFLKYCELKQHRSVTDDASYAYARLCQVIGNFFGGSLSIGIDMCCHLDCDNGDNGTYIIKGWKIVDRKYHHGFEQNSYDLLDMLIAIDKAQPQDEQLGKEFLTAKEVNVSDLKIGDKVFMQIRDGQYDKLEVCGFGTTYVNGHQMKDVPYVALYGDEERGYAWNCNNYIRTKTIRVAKEV